MDPKSSDYLNARTEVLLTYGPCVFMTHLKNKLQKFLAGYPKAILRCFHFCGKYSYNSTPKYKKTCYETYLSWMFRKWPFKKTYNGSLHEQNDPEFNWILEAVEKNRIRYPSGKSSKCEIHLLQLVGGEKGKPIFRKFNYYDKKENMKHYDQATPPDFDFSKIKVKVCALVGTSDDVTTKENLAELAKHMPEGVWHLKMVEKLKHTSYRFPRDMAPFKDYINEHLNLEE